MAGSVSCNIAHLDVLVDLGVEEDEHGEGHDPQHDQPGPVVVVESTNLTFSRLMPHSRQSSERGRERKNCAAASFTTA